MSFINDVCSFLGSVFGAVFVSIVPIHTESVVDTQAAINNIRAIYNNSPRNLEECNFTDFVERFGLTSGLSEVVTYRDDETLEVTPV